MEIKLFEKTSDNEACEKDINFTKSSHIKYEAQIENEVISRKNKNLTDKTYTNLSPEFDHVNGLVKRNIDARTQ